MSIITLDGVIAGMQYPRDIVKAATGTMVIGRPFSLFYQAGSPGAAAIPSPGVTGEALTTYAGQIPFTNPISGNSYLARFQGQATVAGRLLLCDRLWHNSGLDIASTSAQDVNSVAFPARDANGSINGESVLVGLEVTANLGAGTPTLSIVYTNPAGTGEKTGAGILTVVASSLKGTFYMIGLADGDTGVKSIQTFTKSATMTSGSYSLVAYRILAGLELTAANIPNAIDAITSGFPKLFNNTVPFLLFIPSATTTSYISAQVIWTQG